MIILNADAISERILEIFFPTPKSCLLCGEKLKKFGICQNCQEKIDKLQKETGRCARCGTFSHHGVYCPNCVHWPEGYIKNTAPVPYQEEYEKVIQSFKYGYQGYVAKAISVMIYNELLKNPALIRDSASAIVIPVPMSIRRKRQKGYNQAEVLAREFAILMNVPMLRDVLIRPRDTRHQVGLNIKLRKTNLGRAFAISQSKIKKIENKTIILVDDVLTTSATLQGCATILLNSGAEKVFSVTFSTGNPRRKRMMSSLSLSGGL